MSWSIEQLLGHKKVKNLLGVNPKSQVQATENTKVNQKPATRAALSFIVVGDPMGKPRMTQRDVWKKRPVVLRYRDFCDRIREATPNRVFEADVYAIDIVAYIAMPDSWSEKKKKEHDDRMHRTKPDWDNIGKAICDAIFKDDSIIGSGRCRKYWCRDGQQRTEIKVSFHVHQN